MEKVFQEILPRRIMVYNIKKQLRGRNRLALIIEAIGATGIRVSELKYLTVQAALNRKAQVTLKGKIRTILLPGKLCKKLIKYAQKQKITSGEIWAGVVTKTNLE